jgi:hypothetical protein
VQNKKSLIVKSQQSAYESEKSAAEESLDWTAQDLMFHTRPHIVTYLAGKH